MIDISVSSLVKSFELGKNILDGLSFTVNSGERVGILGQRGGQTALREIVQRHAASGKIVCQVKAQIVVADRRLAHAIEPEHAARDRRAVGILHLERDCARFVQIKRIRARGAQAHKQRQHQRHAHDFPLHDTISYSDISPAERRAAPAASARRQPA